MADVSVFVDYNQWPEAVDYYNTFPREQALSVRVPPHRVDADFLSLLEKIHEVGNRLILIVCHANPQGLVMPLTGRRGGGRPTLATSSALVLLMEIALVHEAVERIRLKPVSQQRAEDWFEVLKRVTRARPETRREHPAQALFATDEPPIYRQFRRNLNEKRAEIDRRRTEAERTHPNSPASARRLEDLLAELQRVEAQFESAMRDQAESYVRDWLRIQTRTLGLRDQEVSQLIDAMKEAQSLRLKRVMIRGCNLGQSEEAMTVLCYFLGADILDAPRVTTIFAPLHPMVGPNYVQRRTGRRAAGICGADELRRPGGCGWSYEGERFRLFVKHLDGTHYYLEATADTPQTVQKWATDRFGLPQSRLGSRFPIHFLFTAPPAFPQEPQFRDHMSRVVGGTLSPF